MDELGIVQDWTGIHPEALARFVSHFDILHDNDDCFLIGLPGNALLDLHINVRAALNATKLGLRSIDYAKKRYTDEREEQSDELGTLLETVLDQVRRSTKEVLQPKKTSPAVGQLAARAALIRLQASFFSSSLLFRMGWLLEARTVSRMICEQVAWAFAVCRRETTDFEELRPTQCISALKQFHPEAGRTYGVLSRVAHLEAPLNRYYVEARADHGNDDGGFWIRYGESRDACTQSAVILLLLADMYSTVSEYVVYTPSSKCEAVAQDNEGRIRPSPHRPFLQQVTEYRDKYWPKKS